MKCIYCGYYATYVIDSRNIKNETIVRRRRECPECKGRFTTYETVRRGKVS